MPSTAWAGASLRSVTISATFAPALGSSRPAPQTAAPGWIRASSFPITGSAIALGAAGSTIDRSRGSEVASTTVPVPENARYTAAINASHLDGEWAAVLITPR